MSDQNQKDVWKKSRELYLKKGALSVDQGERNVPTVKHGRESNLSHVLGGVVYFFAEKDVHKPGNGADANSQQTSHHNDGDKAGYFYGMFGARRALKAAKRVHTNFSLC